MSRSSGESDFGRLPDQLRHELVDQLVLGDASRVEWAEVFGRDPDRLPPGWWSQLTTAAERWAHSCGY